MLFFILNFGFLAFVIFLVLILSMAWPPDSPWAPWWTTPKEVTDVMCREAKVNSKDNVYDLGCGTGIALITAAKKYGAKGVGVEIDPLRFTLARFNIWRFGLKKKIKLERGNFFLTDLTPATVIFMYLIPRAMRDLAPKFLKELKPGSRLVSYHYELEPKVFKGKLKLIKHDKGNQVFVYALTK